MNKYKNNQNDTENYTEVEQGIEKIYESIKKLQLEQREVYLNGEIDAESSLEVIEQIRYLNTINNEPIMLYINSPGGDVTNGLAIVDCIRDSISPIVGMATGQIMSMAIPVLAICDIKVATKYCHFMAHSPSADFGEMNFTDFQTHTSYLDLIIQQQADLLEESTKLPRQDWVEMLTSPEKYFTSKQALEYGLIEEII